jgi:hypothetical protein
MEVIGEYHTPAPLLPEKNHGTLWIGAYLGHWVRLIFDIREKFLPLPQFESRAVYKAEGRYHLFIYKLPLLPLPILRYHPASAFSQKHLSNVGHFRYTEVRILFPWIDLRIVPDAVPFPLQTTTPKFPSSHLANLVNRIMIVTDTW